MEAEPFICKALIRHHIKLKMNYIGLSKIQEWFINIFIIIRKFTYRLNVYLPFGLRLSRVIRRVKQNKIKRNHLQCRTRNC